LSWRLAKQGEFFERMRATMAELADGMNAEFKYAITLRLSRVITVHPLGGCPMSPTSRHGVVDEFGKVHGYAGLYIADGSVIPGPVGPNPSLTIAALADLFADRMLGVRRIVPALSAEPGSVRMLAFLRTS
jgi:cholesterol oxidase